MTEKNIPEFCTLLNAYLMERFGYVHALVKTDNKTIYCNEPQIDLYLRWDIARSMVTIARIYFKETGVGHGRSFINFLISNAVQFSYRKIQIECANANSSAFAAKVGFVNLYYNHWFLDITEHG